VGPSPQGGSDTIFEADRPGAGQIIHVPQCVPAFACLPPLSPLRWVVVSEHSHRQTGNGLTSAMTSARSQEPPPPVAAPPSAPAAALRRAKWMRDGDEMDREGVKARSQAIHPLRRSPGPRVSAEGEGCPPDGTPPGADSAGATVAPAWSPPVEPRSGARAESTSQEKKAGGPVMLLRGHRALMSISPADGPRPFIAAVLLVAILATYGSSYAMSYYPKCGGLRFDGCGVSSGGGSLSWEDRCICSLVSATWPPMLLALTLTLVLLAFWPRGLRWRRWRAAIVEKATPGVSFFSLAAVTLTYFVSAALRSTVPDWPVQDSGRVSNDVAFRLVVGGWVISVFVARCARDRKADRKAAPGRGLDWSRSLVLWALTAPALLQGVAGITYSARLYGNLWYEYFATCLLSLCAFIGVVGVTHPHWVWGEGGEGRHEAIVEADPSPDRRRIPRARAGLPPLNAQALRSGSVIAFEPRRPQPLKGALRSGSSRSSNQGPRAFLAAGKEGGTGTSASTGPPAGGVSEARGGASASRTPVQVSPPPRPAAAAGALPLPRPGPRPPAAPGPPAAPSRSRSGWSSSP